ncbi:MAG: ATP-binding protein [Anaerobutyricum hallii]|uniref:ATP-binding protein n=1 Tax=Anaerobutyricum hallii TaxID=39488 RepID=UPI00242CBA47|nr:ATP-binding protein [Anaerobutyricum hallii]MDD6588328.1 ATP-binding protein [Anaerobutyricum hallii]
MEERKYTTPEMQYAFQETSGYSIVSAEYIQCEGKAKGNPLIEALPPLLNEEGRKATFNHGVILPENLDEMSLQQKLDSLECLLDFRTELPMDSKFEYHFHKAIRESYLKRETMHSSQSNIKVHTGDGVIEQNQKLIPTNMSEPVEGISITGIGGSGKSTSVNAVLDLYPQTIIHNMGTVDQFVQIPYLIVNIHPDYNIGSVYEAIGEAIDRALRNLTPYYENEVFKAKKLGDKERLIKNYINVFHVGALILDEIQMLSLKTTKRGYSISNFLVLANETSVALVAIGTREAFLRLFDDPHNARRFAHNINSEVYVENKRAFEFILRRLWNYRYFTDPVNPSAKIIDAMYEETHGIINMLMILWAYIQTQYMLKPTEITADFIKKCSNRSMDLLKLSVDRYDYKKESISMKKAVNQMIAAISERGHTGNDVGEIVDVARTQAYVEEKILELYPEVSKKAIFNSFTRALKLSGGKFTSDSAAVRETLKTISEMQKIHMATSQNNIHSLIEEINSEEVVFK